MTPEAAFSLLEPISEIIPFNALVGIRLESVNEKGVSMVVDHRPQLTNNPVAGTLHGGVVSSLLDVVGGMSALAAMIFEQGLDDLEKVLERFAKFGTVDLRIDYLRPSRGDRYIGSGTVMRSGRRIAVTRMELLNEKGVLLATGTGTYITS